MNQEINKSGPFGRLLAMVKILEDDIETSSYTFIFNEGVTPSLQYRRDPQFFSREANKEELDDFLQLLNQPLFLKYSPR
ncbi:hypothetical protein IID21_05065 [Patescibacteria group bacterium]|nr:hypothetical protein [Patescibacteria group bacterium]